MFDKLPDHLQLLSNNESYTQHVMVLNAFIIEESYFWVQRVKNILQLKEDMRA